MDLANAARRRNEELIQLQTFLQLVALSVCRFLIKNSAFYFIQGNMFAFILVLGNSRRDKKKFWLQFAIRINAFICAILLVKICKAYTLGNSIAEFLLDLMLLSCIIWTEKRTLTLLNEFEDN